jgi:phospholipid transport system substrate-binding protein
MISKNYLKKLAVFLMIFSFSFPARGFSTEVTDGMRQSVDEILSLINKEKDKKIRRGKIEKEVNRRFDYVEMAKRALANNWNDRTPEERQEFSEAFAELLRNTYITKIEKYTDEKIDYLKEIISPEGVATLKTRIIKKDDEIAVDYRMIKKGDEWVCYDFIIENVSMIRNYRSQFGKIIKDSSYADLLKRMKNKISKLKEDEEKGEGVKDRNKPSEVEDI